MGQSRTKTIQSASCFPMLVIVPLFTLSMYIHWRVCIVIYIWYMCVNISNPFVYLLVYLCHPRQSKISKVHKLGIYFALAKEIVVDNATEVRLCPIPLVSYNLISYEIWQFLISSIRWLNSRATDRHIRTHTYISTYIHAYTFWLFSPNRKTFPNSQWSPFHSTPFYIHHPRSY